MGLGRSRGSSLPCEGLVGLGRLGGSSLSSASELGEQLVSGGSGAL